ncbi:hypothetical protein [Actinomadura sp. RB99]|uniref:hypothetical protein n=1 Tax=Actinomadura sp. RB99 TaxID=2691577 RepID=UPI001F50A926|nr:hypothetical protein [Actinomadura sp. RB99]
MGAAVAAVADGLRGVVVHGAEGVGEGAGGQAHTPEGGAVVADLPVPLAAGQVREIEVVERVAADLVAGGGEVHDLAPGHAAGPAKKAGADEEGRLHPVAVQQGADVVVLVLEAVVEGERHPGPRLRVREERRADEHQGPAGSRCPMGTVPSLHDRLIARAR